MPSILDGLGGLIQQGEQKVGSFLQGLIPGQAPSRPMSLNNPPLPSTQASPTQPNNSPLLGNSPRQQPNVAQNWKNWAFNPLQFDKDVGLSQLGSNFMGDNAKDPNTFVGQTSDPNSPVNQFKKNVDQYNPLKGVAIYVGNVLNAGIVDPIKLAADPQMWFAEDNNPHPQPSVLFPGGWDNLTGPGQGHNYLRDVFNPVVKTITGEDVPPTTYNFQRQAQQLTQEGQQLQEVQGKLTPQSSQADIDAYNTKLQAYNVKISQYQANYLKSQDWWANSNTAKTLSVLGQVATFPAGFAAGFATFIPQLAADPIGAGEGMVGQVQQGANFVSKLMNPETRDHMSAQELAANLSNIAMLAGMLYGAKGMVKGGGKGAVKVKDTILGPKVDPLDLAKVKSGIQAADPEHRNPEQAPTATTPTIDPRSPASQINANIEQRMQDASLLRDKLSTTQDPTHKAVLIKQMNDITDEIQTLRNESSKYAKAASQPESPLNVEQQTSSDLSNEFSNEQRPQYTQPVFPSSGSPETPIDTLLRGASDFTRSSIQQEAMRRRPQDYASPNATTGELPTTNFEEMSPRSLESLAASKGLEVTTPDKITDNAWIDPRTGKAINFREPQFEIYQHEDFIEAMRQPGDVRDADQIMEDMIRQGFIKVSEQAGMRMYAVDMLDPENAKTIGQSIEGDIKAGFASNQTRIHPYQVVETATNRAYKITPQELAANNFDLGRTIIQQRRIMPRSETGETPIQVGPQVLNYAIEDRGWRQIPASKVEYGWLFPNGKGVDIRTGGEYQGDHLELMIGMENTLKALDQLPTSGELSYDAWSNIARNFVELRRGYAGDIGDHYFFVRDLNPSTIKVIEDYLSNKSQNRPTNIVIERQRPDRTIQRSDFTYDEFKNNDFKLEGLTSRTTPRTFSESGEISNINDSPWLYDKFTQLRKVQNQVNFLEDRINKNAAAGKNIRADEISLRQALEDAQKTINDLPKEVPNELQKQIQFIQEKLNEKGYTAIVPSEPESTTGATSEGYNQAPSGAPEGSTLASVVPGPKGQGSVAFWQSDAKSTGAISAYQRGRLELAGSIKQWVVATLRDNKNLEVPANLKDAPVSPANIVRREQEITSAIKSKMSDLDPLGFANIKHVVFDTNLESEAQYDPWTGMITINPAKGIPESWIRGAGTQLGRQLAKWKLEKGDSLPSTDALQYAKNWIDSITNLPQSQRDWSAAAEEILHKHDTDYFNIGEYFNALLTLPTEWWEHASRSGLGDNVEGGLNFYNENKWVPLLTKEGLPVNNWLEAFNLGRMNRLNDESLNAVFHTFVEYRVTQLNNYHGIPGAGYTYRVPEVFYREFQNPDLIAEGAKLAGDSFEQYVTTQTAPRLAQQNPLEEAALSDRAAAAGVPSNAPAVSTSIPAGDIRSTAGNQNSLEQDFPQPGDMLQVNLGTSTEPNWTNFYNNPLRDMEEARKASEIVSSAGANLGQGSAALSNTSYRRQYRVINPKTRAIRDFQGSIPQEPEITSTQSLTPEQHQASSQAERGITPKTFHNISVPEINPSEPTLGTGIASTGFSPKSLRLTDINVPKKDTSTLSTSIPNSIGAKFEYQPLTELGKTGYPGSWQDFLGSMASPEDSLPYRTAKPYWDKLEPRWQQAFMEAIKEPGVEGEALDRQQNPSVTPAGLAEINSPAFQARQLKIQDYRTKIAKSGPALDSLRKSINTANGLEKYARAKASMAAMQKYVEQSPGIPEKEATQIAGAEFTRVMEEVTNEQPSAPLPTPGVNVSTPTRQLLQQWQPIMRRFVESRVTIKDTEGKRVGYPSLEAFIDAYAAGEEKAKKIQARLSKTSKDAIRNIVAQMPQSFQLPSKIRPDQTSIPESQQASQEHINPSSESDMRAIVESANKIFVRHGSTEYNEKGFVRSHDNPPLSSLGRLQARNLARAFRGLKNLKIITHDLDRAQDTATAIARMARGSKVIVDTELRPWNVGKALTGTSVTAANPRMQRMMWEQPDFVPEGGESFNQFKDRYLNALRKYIYTNDVIVGSTRNLRLAEAWITQGAPMENIFDEAPLKTVREIGPGGVMGVVHQKDGTFTISAKASQLPSDAANMEVPKVQSTIPLKPQSIKVKIGGNAPGEQTRDQVQRSIVNENAQRFTTAPPVETPAQTKSKITVRINKDTATIKGEVISKVTPDIKDEIASIVNDPSILATDPLKVAAVKARDAIDNVNIARTVQVPQEQLRAQIQEQDNQLDRVAQLKLERAQEAAKAAKLFAPKNNTHPTFTLSTKEAQNHQSRIAQGEDYNVSAHQAAKKLGFKNPSDALAQIKNAGQSLLPTGHRAYNLSPAYKDVFINPQAVELMKSENLSEPPKQGILPLSPEVSLGVNVPVSADPTSKSKPNIQIVKPKAPVIPAAADHLAAHSPAPEVPQEEHPREAVKKYTVKIKDHDKKSTKNLTDETTQLEEKINLPSPDFFHDTELERLEEEATATQEKAKQGVAPTPADKAPTGSGGGGGRKSPPINPMKGWDDARNVVMNHGGKMRSLALRYDYALKMMTNLLDPSANAASHVGMANAFQAARVESAYVGDEIHQLENDLIPMKTEGDLARHQAIAKAVGGDNELVRNENLEKLSQQDQAIANMFHAYHKVMGVLGARPESKLWEAAQDDYFPRRVLGFDGQKIDASVPNLHRNTAWSEKLGIARERAKYEAVLGIDDEGNKIVKTTNLYKDNEALKAAGFQVEENVANLQKFHWDSFSNMMLSHQFLKVLSTLDASAVSQVRPGRFAGEGNRIKLGSNAAPYVGRLLVPRMEMRNKKMQATQVDPKYRSQLTTVEKGPFARVLEDHLVYKPLAEHLERMTSSKASDNLGERLANYFAEANNTFKIFKFGFNPIHLYNLLSNVYSLGTNGLLDKATYNPVSLHHRIFGRTEALLQDKTTFKDWNGQDINGKDMIAKIMHWGGVLPKDIIDVNNLGGLTGVLARKVPGFKQWHNFMWQQVAWKGQIGMTLHLIDVMRSELESNKGLGRPLNEAEFENVGRLATEQAKYAMGFITKEQMSRDWQVYGNALFLANSWTLSQLRLLGMATPKGLPARDFLANLGGGEKYNDVMSEQMRTLGQMDQNSLEKINGYQGKFARKLMLGGAAKLLATSFILTYLGSYFGNQGQAQGPWQNFQRDPTHTFDIYHGIDPQTGKDQWVHNPLFGMQQEMALYFLQAIKEHDAGGNPYDIATSVGGRLTNKANPVLSTALDIAINRNLGLYLQGYGDRSDISADPQIIAVTRALDATGKNPFPDSFTNNFVYAMRTLFPSPGFPGNLDVSHGTNPSQTNATLGNVLNAVGAGKTLGMGDLINAAQTGDGSSLIPKDLGNLALWATGSRIATSSTPEQLLTNSNINSSIQTKDAKNQALADMAQAATTGDWKTVAQLSNQLGLTNSQMISAIEHPPSGFGGGAGIIYSGLPTNQQAPLPGQEVLNGQELTIAQTSQLENMKEAATIAMIQEVTALPEFQSGDKTTRTAMIASYVSLITNMVNDQYAQQIGQIGGNPITNTDIQVTLGNAVEFRRAAEDVLGQMQLYQQADPLERQRMETTFNNYAITLAKDSATGNLRGVPIENVKQILTYTINAEEITRQWLQNTMYYQLAAQGDQQRMLTEYSALARTMAKREALGQGQGSYAFQIPADKVIPTIEFIMSVEEAGKAALHGTDYYYNNPAEQKSLDLKYETLARGLAFSTSEADPRTLIENSLAADQSFYDLQNQFGGSNYIKLMAQQLTDLERNVRTSSNYSPQQITSLERVVRQQFLAQNPAYAAYLKTRTAWEKNTTVGQIYSALNKSEFAAVSDMQAAGVIPSETLISSGSSIDNTTPLDVTQGVGLPSINYNTFQDQNP